MGKYLDKAGLEKLWWVIRERYAEKASVPTKLSQLLNDPGYLRQHQDITGKSDVGHTHVQTDISGLHNALSGKIDKPNEAAAVGKVLKVKTVNADGSFVCEWADGGSGGAVDDVTINGESIVSAGVADIPIAAQNKKGVVALSGSLNGLEMESSGAIVIKVSDNADIDARRWKRPIVPTNLNYAVKAALTDSKRDTGWTDDAKAAACDTIGAYRKLSDGWVLKGTLSGTADDRGNIDTGVNVDLTGCSELIIHGDSEATGTVTIATNDRPLNGGIIRSGKFTIYDRHEDTIIGIQCIQSGYMPGSNNALINNNVMNTGYNWLHGKHISDITKISFATPSNVTSCSIKIYAR